MDDRPIRRGASDTCFDTRVIGERRPRSPRVLKKRGPDGRTHACMHARRTHALTRIFAQLAVSEASERGKKMGNPARDETRMTGGSARESVMIHRGKEG